MDLYRRSSNDVSNKSLEQWLRHPALHQAIASQSPLQRAQARIPELQGQLRQMKEMAYPDALTGSLNRRELDMVLRREIARAVPLSVAVLDLDDCKRINDQMGHRAGDMALIHFTQTVSKALRKTDRFARTGGVEFVIVLPGTDLAGAMRILMRVRRVLSEAILHLDSCRIHLTCSAGIASLRHGEEAAALIQRADAGMTEARKRGKNCVVVEAA